MNDSALFSDWDIIQFKYLIGFGNEFNLNVDTFLISKIDSSHVVGGPKLYYFYCDSFARGFALDYYNNGQLRIKGSFVNGNSTDALITSYNSGVVSEIYDSIFGIRIITNYENRQLDYFYNYWEFNLTKYYKTGELKEIHDWRSEYYIVGEFLYTNEFNVELDYFNNGNKKEKVFAKELYKMNRILHPKATKFIQIDFLRHIG